MHCIIFMKLKRILNIVYLKIKLEKGEVLLRIGEKGKLKEKGNCRGIGERLRCL